MYTCTSIILKKNIKAMRWGGGLGAIVFVWVVFFHFVLVLIFKFSKEHHDWI